jgi:endonuclease YncB( thermonuclease family)
LPEPASAAESPSPDPLPAEAPSPVPTDRDPIVAGWVPWTAHLGAVLRRRFGGLDAARRRLGGGGLPRLPRLSVLPLPQSRLGLRSVLSLAAVAILVPLVAILAMSLISDSRATRPPDAPTTVAARSAAEPDATGTVPGQDPPPPGPAAGPLRGVPEVLDTATLSVQGKVVRLFGVEWARGAGDPDDLAGYLRGREVVCRPEGATERYRCEVQGQDLSRVVLFNGGGRATPDATSDLKAAEEHARSQQIGVWGPESLKARP